MESPSLYRNPAIIGHALVKPSLYVEKGFDHVFSPIEKSGVRALAEVVWRGVQFLFLGVLGIIAYSLAIPGMATKSIFCGCATPQQAPEDPVKPAAPAKPKQVTRVPVQPGRDPLAPVVVIGAGGTGETVTLPIVSPAAQPEEDRVELKAPKAAGGDKKTLGASADAAAARKPQSWNVRSKLGPIENPSFKTPTILTGVATHYPTAPDGNCLFHSFSVFLSHIQQIGYKNGGTLKPFSHEQLRSLAVGYWCNAARQREVVGALKEGDAASPNPIVRNLFETVLQPLQDNIHNSRQMLQSSEIRLSEANKKALAANIARAEKEIGQFYQNAGERVGDYLGKMLLNGHFGGASEIAALCRLFGVSARVWTIGTNRGQETITSNDPWEPIENEHAGQVIHLVIKGRHWEVMVPTDNFLTWYDQEHKGRAVQFPPTPEQMGSRSPSPTSALVPQQDEKKSGA